MKKLSVILLVILIGCTIPTPTPTISPVTPTPQPSPINYQVTPTLVNPSFELPFGCILNACTANGWTAWYEEDYPCWPGDEGCWLPCPTNCLKEGSTTICDRNKGSSCFWKKPEFKRADRLQFPERVRTGNSAQQAFVYGAQGRGGVYQQAYIPSAGKYLFGVYVQAWMCFDFSKCTAKHSDLPTKMHLKVGIDPTGGVDALAPSVVWGQEIESFDKYSFVNVITDLSKGTSTMFVYFLVDWEGSHLRLSNDVYFDDGVIMPVNTQIFFPFVTKQ